MAGDQEAVPRARPNQSLQRRLKDQAAVLQRNPSSQDKRRIQEMTTAAAKAAAAVGGSSKQTMVDPCSAINSRGSSVRSNKTDSKSTATSVKKTAHDKQQSVVERRRREPANGSAQTNNTEDPAVLNAGSNGGGGNDVLVAATRALAASQRDNPANTLVPSRDVASENGSKSSSLGVPSSSANGVSSANGRAITKLGPSGLPMIISVSNEPATMAPPSNDIKSATAASSLAFKKKMLRDKEEKDKEIKTQQQLKDLQDGHAQVAEYLSVPQVYLSEPDTDYSDAGSLLSHDVADKNNAISAAKLSVKHQQRPLSVLSDHLRPDSGSEIDQQFTVGAAKLAAHKISMDEHDRDSILSHIHEQTSKKSLDVEREQLKEKNALAAAMAAKLNVDDAVEKINTAIASKGPSAQKTPRNVRYQPAAVWSGFHNTTLREGGDRRPGTSTGTTVGSAGTTGAVDRSASDSARPPLSALASVYNVSNESIGGVRAPRTSVDTDSRVRMGVDSSEDRNAFMENALEKQKRFLREHPLGTEADTAALSKTAPAPAVAAASGSKRKSNWGGMLKKLINKSKEKEKENKQPEAPEHILRPTMRKDPKKSFNEDKPWKHHRNALIVTEKEKKRYEGVWAANKGIQVPYLYFGRLDDYETEDEEHGRLGHHHLGSDDDVSSHHGFRDLLHILTHHEDDGEAKHSTKGMYSDEEDEYDDDDDDDEYEEDYDDDDDEYDEDEDEDFDYADEIKDAQDEVHGLVCRDLWRRSRLSDSTLEHIWSLVDKNKDGSLDRDSFLVGMWLVDQCLYGRKLPSKIDAQVWNSVARLSLKIRVNKAADKKQKKQDRKRTKKNKKKRRKEPRLVVLHPSPGD